MSATNFNTENSTYRKLIGNGLTYRIPRFQRDYSWTDVEWEDLWVDILEVVQENGEPAHYMGYLVLQAKDEKTFDIIDGQQRLTTLSLVALAILKTLKKLVDDGINPEENKQRLEELRRTYIGYLDTVTLLTRSKLTLNRNNNDYYQTYLIPLGHLPQRGFRASEHSLRKGFEWFEKRVNEYTKKNNSNDSGVVLAKFLGTMSDKLFFTAIYVTDELNAYKVFETLNARGVRLSSTDLLKNYLFSILSKSEDHQHEIITLEDRWEAMVSRLGSESFPDFLRYHWISRRSFVRQSELFKTIRGKINNRAGVFELLRDMEEDMESYLALTNPEASSWPSEWKIHAQHLRMFKIRQSIALLLTARRNLSNNDFGIVLRAMVDICFRYNIICSQPPNEQERVYASTAQKLNTLEITTALQLLQSLKLIYPDDQMFKTAFADKVIRTSDARNNRIVRYVLCELERQNSNTAHDFGSDTFDVEHVLPQNADFGWEAFSNEEVEALTYRIGNMTLLEKSKNKEIANLGYAVKRPVLQSSQFSFTQLLAQDSAEWTPERISIRQNQLAKIASSIWRVSQLS